MNSCILMAQVARDPELRSTQDQTSVATMLVEFESTREGEAPGQLKVEAWGNLAEQVSSTYRTGNQIVIQGRLSMNTVDMPEGYKQKVAKLVASRIYPLTGANAGMSDNVYSPQPTNIVDFAPEPAPEPAPAPQPQAKPAYAAPATAPAPEPAPSSNEDWDEIPF